MTEQEHFNLDWCSKVLDSNVSDESDAVPMEKVKRMLRIASEDGGSFFRAITVLDNIQLKIDRAFDKVESYLDA